MIAMVVILDLGFLHLGKNWAIEGILALFSRAPSLEIIGLGSTLIFLLLCFAFQEYILTKLIFIKLIPTLLCACL